MHDSPVFTVITFHTYPVNVKSCLLLSQVSSLSPNVGPCWGIKGQKRCNHLQCGRSDEPPAWCHQMEDESTCVDSDVTYSVNAITGTLLVFCCSLQVYLDRACGQALFQNSAL